MQLEAALRPGPRADLDAWLQALGMLEASLDYLEDNAGLAACADVRTRAYTALASLQANAICARVGVCLPDMRRAPPHHGVHIYICNQCVQAYDVASALHERAMAAAEADLAAVLAQNAAPNVPGAAWLHAKATDAFEGTSGCIATGQSHFSCSGGLLLSPQSWGRRPSTRLLLLAGALSG